MSLTPEDEQRVIEITALVNARNAELEARGGGGSEARGGNWRSGQSRLVRWIPPGYWLTQWGSLDQPFRAQPRFEGLNVEVEVSMVRGRQTLEKTARLVTHKPPKPNSAIRFFRTTDLWLNGYVVAATPTRKNPHHASVHYKEPVPIESASLAQAHWNEPGRVTLDHLAVPADEAQ